MNDRSPLPTAAEIASWSDEVRAEVSRALDETSHSHQSATRPPRQRRLVLAICVELPVLTVLVATIIVMLHRTGKTVARLRGLPVSRSMLRHELPMAPPRHD